MCKNQAEELVIGEPQVLLDTQTWCKRRRRSNGKESGKQGKEHQCEGIKAAARVIGTGDVEKNRERGGIWRGSQEGEHALPPTTWGS